MTSALHSLQDTCRSELLPHCGDQLSYGVAREGRRPRWRTLSGAISFYWRSCQSLSRPAHRSLASCLRSANDRAFSSACECSFECPFGFGQQICLDFFAGDFRPGAFFAFFAEGARFFASDLLVVAFFAAFLFSCHGNSFPFVEIHMKQRSLNFASRKRRLLWTC